MRVRAPEPCGEGFRLGFSREVLEAIEASRHAVAIDGPEGSVFGIARLDDIDPVGRADHAARMYLDRIEAADREHPRRRDGKRRCDGVGSGAHVAPPFALAIAALAISSKRSISVFPAATITSVPTLIE